MKLSRIRLYLSLFKSVLPLVVFFTGLWFATAIVSASTSSTFISWPDENDVAISGPHSILNAPDAYFIISSTTSTPIHIQIQDACNKKTAGVFGTTATIVDGPSAGYSQTANSPGDPDCHGNNFDFYGVGTNTPGSATNGHLYYVTVHVSKINGEGHQPFWVYANSSDPSANVVASYVADANKSSSTWSGSDNNSTFSFWSQGDTSFYFRPDCSYSGSYVYFKWSDVDYGQPIQPGHVSWTLYDRAIGTSAWNFVKSESDGTLGTTSNNHEFYGTNLNVNDDYKWEWTGLNPGVNAIQVGIPFQQNLFQSGITCGPTWHLSGYTSVGNSSLYPGQSTPFYNSVQNLPASQDPATYTWQVQGSLGGAPYSSAGYPSGTVNAPGNSPGALNPDHVQNNVIPWGSGSSAWGQTFCERIIYTNGNGPNNPPGGAHLTSAPACTTLIKPTTPQVSCGSTYLPYKTSAPDAAPPFTPHSVDSGASTSNTWSSASVPIYSTATITNTTLGGSWSYIVGQTLNGSPPIFSHSAGSTYHSGTTVNYTPTSPTITITIDTYEYALEHLAPNHYYLYHLSSTPYSLNCYTGTVTNGGACSLAVSGGYGPAGQIYAGQPISVSGVIFNPPSGSPYQTALPPSVPGLGNLNINFNGGQYDWGAPIPIGASSGTIGLGTISANGGPNPTYQTISITPAYGTTAIGPACSITFPVYAPFALTPNMSVTLANGPNITPEDPNSVNNDVYVTGSGTAVSEPVSSSLYEVTVGGVTIPHGSTTNGGPFGPGTTVCLYQAPPAFNVPGCSNVYNGQYPPSLPLHAGDNYCATINIPVSTGYVGPAGDIIPGYTGNPPPDCAVVVNRPFFKVAAGAIQTGGTFASAGNCNAAGELGGWYNYSGPTYYGTGSQLHALAVGPIVGVGSDNNSPMKLNFSNTTNNAGSDLDGVYYSPNLGGLFGGSHCLTSLTAGTGPDTHIFSSSTTIPGMTIPTNHQVTYEITNGDVYISGNITLASSGGGWTVGTSSNIPSFTLIVDNGNIYIDKSVTQLDGVYTARNAPLAGNGQIFTCGNPYNHDPDNSLFNSCNNQLTVNGSFIARKIDFTRTFGSLRDETAPFGGNCSNQGVRTSFQTCAAEVINFSPERYLSVPDIAPQSGGSIQYDALTSLPPVL